MKGPLTVRKYFNTCSKRKSSSKWRKYLTERNHSDLFSWRPKKF